MSLKALLKAGRELLKADRPRATPATGQQPVQQARRIGDNNPPSPIDTPKPSQQTGKELVTQELKNPPVVLKKTKPLQMGDDMAPAFGSSTYDWVMRKGRGTYTADEWIDHLTSTRKINFKVFGKPSSRIERSEKRFKYDSGPFAGKEVNISKEELFDTNLATFNEGGDITGGLLAAAKKFGIKLNANDVGAMIKLNPLNRVKPIELGASPGVKEAFDKSFNTARSTVQNLQVKYKGAGTGEIKESLDDLQYYLNAAGRGGSKSAINDVNGAMKRLSDAIPQNERIVLNKTIGDLNTKAAPLQKTMTQYGDETNYTLQGGKDYRETIMTLPEEIPTNRNPFNKGGHFTSEIGEANNLYHIRYDTRFTPEGKKVFMINEIQSDVNQSIAKSLTKAQQLDGSSRVNPFQKDIEMKLILGERDKLGRALEAAVAKGDDLNANVLASSMAKNTKELQKMAMGGKRSNYDYFPMVEADQYGDHALKYLLQKAAKENVDYVAVAPFDKLSFRQGYKAGNERFYGYSSGKGINKSGSAVMPDVMKKAARLYSSKAGPTKISLSDPSLPYKKISSNSFEYPSSHKLSNKKIKNTYHEDASKGPRGFETLVGKDYVFMESSNPNLYFDAFAIKVNPLMRGTQKTYKALGGLVVDIFKPIGYNQSWQ